jgi:hypothetical protein
VLWHSCEKTINLFLKKNKAHDVLLLPGRSFDSRLNLESEIVVHADGAGLSCLISSKTEGSESGADEEERDKD